MVALNWIGRLKWTIHVRSMGAHVLGHIWKREGSTSHATLRCPPSLKVPAHWWSPWRDNWDKSVKEEKSWENYIRIRSSWIGSGLGIGTRSVKKSKVIERVTTVTRSAPSGNEHEMRPDNFWLLSTLRPQRRSQNWHVKATEQSEQNRARVSRAGTGGKERTWVRAEV